jgi:quercetin dioxygenase-like cupin family protein
MYSLPETTTMERSCRRIVTGHNGAGKAIVLRDETQSTRPIPTGEAFFSRLWVTNCSPADNRGDADNALLPTGLTSPGGSVLRVVDMPPGMRSPMHRTHSIDYGIVMDGDIELELDDGVCVGLKRGDVVVQRGTIHAWINRSEHPARMIFVLLDAAPLTIDGQQLPVESH